MTMRKFLFGIFIIPSLLVFTSCLNEDISNIGSEIQWKPGYALPIGFIEFTLGDFLGDSEGLTPIIESQLDTIAGFIYDNNLFKMPESIVHYENIAFSFPFNDDENIKLTYFNLRTNIRNSIPARLDLQIYFRDGSNVVIDSFYQEGSIQIKPALTNDEGESIEDYESGIVEAVFDENELKKLEATSNVVIKAQVYFNKIQDIITKYNPDQSFWMQLSTEFHLELNTE